MSEKWAVVFEYDLKEGLCVMARREAGAGEVALFDTLEEAEEWVAESGEIEPDLWEINYIRFSV